MSDEARPTMRTNQQELTPTFARVMTVSLTSSAIIHAALLGIVGLALGLPARGLLLPYLLLVWVATLLVLAMYWSRKTAHGPRSLATRSALAIFLISGLYAGALLLSAVMLGLLSGKAALNEYFPYIIPTSAIAAVAAYWAARDWFRPLGSG